MSYSEAVSEASEQANNYQTPWLVLPGCQRLFFAIPETEEILLALEMMGVRILKWVFPSRLRNAPYFPAPPDRWAASDAATRRDFCAQYGVIYDPRYHSRFADLPDNVKVMFWRSATRPLC